MGTMLSKIDFKFWTPFVLFSFFVLLILFIYFFYPVRALTDVKRRGENGFVFEDVRISHFYDSELLFELESRHARVDYSSQGIFLLGCQGQFFQNSDSVFQFQSPKAVFNLNANSLLLEKGKFQFLLQGVPAVLLSNQVYWRLDQGAIRAVGGISLSSSSVLFKGPELFYSFSSHQLVLPKRSTFTILSGELQ